MREVLRRIRNFIWRRRLPQGRVQPLDLTYQQLLDEVARLQADRHAQDTARAVTYRANMHNRGRSFYGNAVSGVSTMSNSPITITGTWNYDNGADFEEMVARNELDNKIRRQKHLLGVEQQFTPPF